MKRVALVVCVITICAVSTAALDPLLNGVEPGRFTQDYASALEYAAEHSLPVFLNFTGSDWCGWCRLMDRAVFSTEGWIEYAAEKVVLVTIDFPQDESKVPEEYRARNGRLQQEFRVRGYPTYVVLDADGSTELGRLGAGSDKTPHSFIREMNEVLRYSDDYLGAFSDRLAGENRDSFSATLAALRELRSSDEDDENRQRELRIRIDGAFREYMFEKMNDAEQERYDDADTAYVEAANELNEWLAGNPERNDENNRVYAGFRSRIDEALETIRSLEAAYLP